MQFDDLDRQMRVFETAHITWCYPVCTSLRDWMDVGSRG